MTRKRTSIVRAVTGYEAVLADVVPMIDTGRRAAVRSSNVIMTATYWGVGRRIVEEEQHGSARVEYGEALIRGCRVTSRHGSGAASARRTWPRCASSTWGTARFSRQCLETLSPGGDSRNSRQRLENSWVSTSWLASRSDRTKVRHQKKRK